MNKKFDENVDQLMDYQRVCNSYVEGWSVELVKLVKYMPRWYGSCDYLSKTIKIRVKSNPDPVETLAHEIAHALTKGDGHGYKFGKEWIRILPEIRKTLQDI